MTRKAGTRGTIGFSGSAGAAPNLAVGSGNKGNPSQTSALLALISPLSEMNLQNYRTMAVILLPYTTVLLVLLNPEPKAPKRNSAPMKMVWGAKMPQERLLVNLWKWVEVS
jgi:hypothetical protein